MATALPPSEPLAPGEALPRAAERVGVELAEHGFAVRSAAELWALAAVIAKSGLKPAGIATQADVFLVMAYGQMYGFHEMEALQRLHVVRGKVCLGASDMAAKIQAHPLCTMYRLWNEGAGEERAGCVQSERAGRGGPNAIVRFTLADARRAGLYDDRAKEASAWVKYADDFLIWKAVARDYRRNWPDAVRGANVYEDLRELERERADVRAPAAIAAPPRASPMLEALAAGSRAIELQRPREREAIECHGSSVAAQPREPEEIERNGSSVAEPHGSSVALGAPSPAEPEPPHEPEPEPEPFAGPLMPGTLETIRRRLEGLLPQHRERAGRELEALVRAKLGAGVPLVQALAAVREWRLTSLGG